MPDAAPRGDINRLRFMAGQLTLPPDAYASATSPVRNPRPIVFETKPVGLD